ncbi:MAG: thiamine phosphate synthase [Magnetococcus sp. YQC-9]
MSSPAFTPLPHHPAILPILDADWLEQAPPTLRTNDFLNSVARCINDLPIPMVQLRAKGTEESSRLFMTRWLAALRQHAPHLRVILNDRLAWVAPLDACGVHVGQGDTPAAHCRELLGTDRIIGLSTHTSDEIRQAEGLPVDYIGFGPIFPTHTKNDSHAVRGVELLARMVRMTRLPIFAIGGITLENLAEVAATGADGAALISALWREDWEQRLRRAVEVWQQNRPMP